MLRYFLIGCLILFSSCQLFYGLKNREIISAPEALPARLVGEIPFTLLSGGIIVVKARINEDFEDTLNFILDSGSGGISLDSTTARQLSLKTQSSAVFLRGFNGNKRLEFSYGHILHLADLRIDSIDFYINNYSFLSAVYGVKIDGIIGYRLLKDFIVKIDYDQREIFFYSPGRYVYERGGYLLNPVIQQIPLVSLGVQKRNASVFFPYYFDLGAGLNLLFSKQFVEDSGLFRPSTQRKYKYYDKVMQSAAGSLMMKETILRKVQIGPFRFHRIPVSIFEDPQAVFSYPFSGGLVGNDLLKRFNITLNYPENEIFLHPNSHFHSSFDYAYTGLTLIRKEGKIYVIHIIPNSPAEIAGLKVGDEIISIDGVFEGSISTYREKLKQVGKAVIIIVKHREQLEKIILKIKSIL